MLPRSAKAAFFAAASPLMRLNGALYRGLRAPKSGVVRVHLGPGQEHYLPGWLNIDANMFTARCDVWADLRNELPLRSNTVAALYSHHVVEHLPNLPFHFADALRCLAPGGAYRVGGPNGDGAIAKFAKNELEWFSEFPDKRRSIGGRLANFLFCRGEHVTMLTFSYLRELMEDAGFTNIVRRSPIRETGFPELFRDALLTEYESDFECPHTLIVEGQKKKG